MPSKSYYEDNWCTKRKKPNKCYNLELLKPAFMLDMIVRLIFFWVLLVRACKAVNCSKTREAILTQPAVLTKEFCNIVPLVLSFPTYLTYLTGTPGRNIRMLKLFIINKFHWLIKCYWQKPFLRQLNISIWNNLQ